MADWNTRFASDTYLFGTRPTAFLTAHAGLIPPGGRALCVAEGEGRNAVYLAQQGCHVTGFDVAPNALDKARRLAASADVALELHVSSLDDWDWTQRFDLVLGSFLQFVPPDGQPALFDRLKGALAPGGRLFLHGYTPEQVAYGTGGPPDPAHMYTEDLLRRHFGGLRLLRLASYETTLDEGPGHSGRSALIDLIAEAPTG
jgi:cyclopropane fatty-acyl-phospholipid synthase-like methyltransferase